MVVLYNTKPAVSGQGIGSTQVINIIWELPSLGHVTNHKP